MFDGVADQFHHLIASRAAPSSSPLPSSTSIPLHHLPLTFAHLTSTLPTSTTNATATTIFPGFDLSHRLEIQQPIPQFLDHPLHHLHHPTTSQTLRKEEDKSDEVDDELASMELLPPLGGGEDCPWTDKEVLALVRIRSSIENWFPEVTREHASRKLEELGFKRSADKCKEKFEEGSRFFGGYNNDDDDDNSYGKNNYRIISELEEICHGNHGRNPRDPNIESNENEMENRLEVKEGETTRLRDSEENIACADEDVLRIKGRMKRKRKRQRQRQKFEMFKRFCEEVVEKLMVQQEEMHSKLIEELVKRDEAMVAREEEWKKREMDMINKELDTRANEQAIAGDRQATVIELLKKFASIMPDNKITCPVGESGKGGGDGHSFLSIPSNNCSTSTSAQPPPTETVDLHCKSKYTKSAAVSNTQTHQTTDNTPSVQKDQNPNPPGTHCKNPKLLAATKVNDLDVVSKRWPRDEVLALINLRSGIDHRDKADHSRHTRSQGEEPLWERISRGMSELGYRRSAKSCKEKWENINKYFRKTKDLRKKRSAESRTCPYFQQLSSLYGHGRIVPPSPSPSPSVGAANDEAV